MARPFARVAHDVRRGLVSREAALRDYGVAIRADGSVDQAASVARVTGAPILSVRGVGVRFGDVDVLTGSIWTSARAKSTA